MTLRTAVCAFLVLAGALRADDVTLTGGRVIQGEILGEEGDALVIKAGFGILKVPRDQVVSIVSKRYVAPPKPASREPVPAGTGSPAPPETKPPAAAQGPDEAEMRARIQTAITAFKGREQTEESDSAEAALAALGKPAVPLIAAEIPKHSAGPALHLTRALALIGGAEAIEALTGQLSAPQAEVRSAAATALAGLGARDAATPLTALLRDEDWTVRRDAAAAVMTLQIRSAVPDLVELVADWHLLVRGQALESLKQLTGQDLGYEKAPWKAWVEANPDFSKDAP